MQGRNSKVPLSMPHPCQNKVQNGLNSTKVFLAFVWDGVVEAGVSQKPMRFRRSASGL